MTNGSIWGIWRYIDDGIHPSDNPTTVLKSIYPAHLTWDWGVQNTLTKIVFLDLYILDFLRPTFCTHFKPTNSTTYIPWEPNTPGAVKLTWRQTEGIGYLRTNSDRVTFEACMYRLTLPVAGWDTPSL